MFGKKTKLDGGDSRNTDDKNNDRRRVQDEKDKRRKRETIMERFQENGYDTGFVYHED
jgi:hypothetical protein